MSMATQKPAPPSIGREVWARLAWFVSMRWATAAGGLLLLLAGWYVLRPHFDPTAARRRSSARTPGGMTGAELQAAIDARSAWREEVFVRA